MSDVVLSFGEDNFSTVGDSKVDGSVALALLSGDRRGSLASAAVWMKSPEISISASARTGSRVVFTAAVCCAPCLCTCEDAICNKEDALCWPDGVACIDADFLDTQIGGGSARTLTIGYRPIALERDPFVAASEVI